MGLYSVYSVAYKVINFYISVFYGFHHASYTEIFHRFRIYRPFYSLVIYRGIQITDIRRIKPNMKNGIKKSCFFSYRSYPMKKEFRSRKIYSLISHVEYWIMRRIKPGV